MRRLQSARSAALVLVPLVLAVSAACGAEPAGAPDTTETPATWVRGDEPWRGMLLFGHAAEPPTVEIDGVPALPETAPAYQVLAPTADDLERLAELHAGGPVTPGLMPGASPDLIGFDTGDGWYQGAPEYMTDEYIDFGGDGWSWTQRAWREHPPVYLSEDDQYKPCPAGTPVPSSVTEFFSRLGMDVAPSGRMECLGLAVDVRLDVFLDGLRINNASAGATIDANGVVVAGWGPFMLFEPLGDVELAPAPAVVRRLITGPGVTGSNASCPEPCAYTTQGATLSLELVRTGGLGSHDHIPGNIVPGPLAQLAVPALSAPAALPAPVSEDAAWITAVALSSALLVDDPAQAELAQTVDEQLTVPADDDRGSACAAPGDTLVLCSSTFRAALGQPLLLTFGGEVHAPVGAAGCTPILTLDPGDGTTLTAPPPRVGTLVSAKTIHVYDAPGTYTVTAHRASRCEEPAPGGGTEPEYEESTQLTITVAE